MIFGLIKRAFKCPALHNINPKITNFLNPWELVSSKHIIILCLQLS